MSDLSQIELNGSIYNLKDATVRSMIVENQIPLIFVQGNLNSGTGKASTINEAKRLRSNAKVSTPYGFSIVVPEGFQAYFYYYSSDSDETYLGNSGQWYTGTATITSTEYKYTRYVMAKQNDTNIVPSDCGNVSIKTRTYIDQKITEALYTSISQTGDVVTFEAPDSDLPIKSITANLEPKQDFHGYGHPWFDGEGKNKLKYPYIQGKVTNGGLVFQPNDDGSISITGKYTGASSTISYQIYSSTSPMPLPNGTYILSTSGSESTSVRLRFAPNSGDTATEISIGTDSSPFTITDGVLYSCVLRVSKDGADLNLTIKPMLRLSTENDSTFEPYYNKCPISEWTGATYHSSGADTSDPNTISVSFPSEATPVYGGTADVIKGKLVANRALVDPTTLTWSYDSTNNRYYTADLVNVIKKPSSNSVLANIACSIFKTATSDDTLPASSENSCIAVSSTGNIQIKGNFASTTDLISAFTDQQIVYETAETNEYQFTPHIVTTVYGANNVWVDDADVTVEYGRYLSTMMSLIKSIVQ